MDTLVWRISLGLFVLSELWNVYWMWRFGTCLLYMLCWRWFVGQVWVVWIVLLCYANWNAKLRFWIESPFPPAEDEPFDYCSFYHYRQKPCFLNYLGAQNRESVHFLGGNLPIWQYAYVYIYIIFTVHQYIYLYTIICNIFLHCTHTCRCFIIFHFMFHSLTSHGQCWLLCSQEAAVKSELGRLLVWSGKRPFRSGGTWGSYKKDSPFVHWFSAIYVGAPSPSICKDSVRGPPSNQTCAIPS